MAVEKVTRVLVAVHESGRDRFMQQLQRLGVLHVTRDESAAEAAAQARDRALARIDSAIEFLGARAGRQAKAKPELGREEFEQAASALARAQPEHEQLLARLDEVNRELAGIDARLSQVESERQLLLPWKGLRHDAAGLYRAFRSATVTALRLPDRAELDRAAEALAGLPAALERASLAAPEAAESEVFAVLVCATGAMPDVEAALSGVRRDAVDLRRLEGRPADLLAALSVEVEDLERRRVALRQEMAGLAEALPTLKVAADALGREVERQRTADALARTASVHFVHGWVRTREMTRLAGLVAESGTAVLVEAEPAEDEPQPVALVNRPVFRPFEMVLELFSMPSPAELDPTWLIAPFFGVFFAVCLTDAGYGIVVAVLTFLLMRRMGMGNKLLGIILIGGVLTIPAGALVGGWFGDMFTPERLNVPTLTRFKDSLLWFDPVKEPMKFFILSIALGYLQMIAGIAFEIADCLRVRNWGDGLLVQLPWFVFLNGLTARFVLAKSLPAWVAAALMVAVLASVAAVIVFTQRAKETIRAQWLWFGLLAGFFVTLGTKFGWLPPVLGHAYWVTLGFFGALLVMAGVSFLRGARSKTAAIALGILTAAALGAYLVGRLPWIAPALAGVGFFAVSPAGRGLLAKLLWGGYALYGATGYIGVVLSYIRLMALGMCTGGVAVAINVIAWMLLKMPVIGVPMAVLVLIGGHAYNIAVNVLGAFVHSLRLQYVEFFPRFYSGGGERFRPFGEQFSYIRVKS